MMRNDDRKREEPVWICLGCGCENWLTETTGKRLTCRKCGGSSFRGSDGKIVVVKPMMRGSPICK